jgi:3-phenylpropionate/trans-cinnamate dioxygenase ferredoxin subunit
MKRSAVRSPTNQERELNATAGQVEAPAEPSAFVTVAAMTDLPAGAATTVDVAGYAVALFNVDGIVYAIDDWDLDNGASIAAGRLEGTIVASTNSRLSYDVTTGGVVGVPGLSVAAYDVRIVDGMITIARVPRRSV